MSTSERDSNLTWKLFVGEFLNTGLLALIMFAKLPWATKLPLGLTIFDGEFEGLPPKCVYSTTFLALLGVVVSYATGIVFAVLCRVDR